MRGQMYVLLQTIMQGNIQSIEVEGEDVFPGWITSRQWYDCILVELFNSNFEYKYSRNDSQNS